MKKLLPVFTFLFLASTMNAQIEAVDLEPDVVLEATTNGEYKIDFDNDGNYDYWVVSTSTSGIIMALGVVAENAETAVVATMNGAIAEPTPLAFGTLIDASSTWIDTTAANGAGFTHGANLGGSLPFAGKFATGEDAYLGVRFVGGDGNLYYGWILLNLTTESVTTTIKAYGYDQTPEKAIKAGNMSDVGLQEKVALVRMYPNPATDQLNISTSEAISNVNIITTDGKTVATSTTASVEIGALNQGTYICEVTTVSGNVIRNTFFKK